MEKLSATDKRVVPELNQLFSDVSKRYAHRLLSTRDFELLSLSIEQEVGETVSPSTFKRLWGYVSHHVVPRLSTLDILARYIGFDSFLTYRNHLNGLDEGSSSWLDSRIVMAAELTPGDTLRIGWPPNRLLLLEYREEGVFHILHAFNSKLQEGDSFHIQCFIKGLPLLIPEVWRNGTPLPGFIAGKASGIDTLEIVQA